MTTALFIHDADFTLRSLTTSPTARPHSSTGQLTADDGFTACRRVSVSNPVLPPTVASMLPTADAPTPNYTKVRQTHSNFTREQKWTQMTIRKVD